MRTAVDVSHELNDAISLLEWAEGYARTAPDADPECWARNQQSIASKIERARNLLDAIDSKIKPMEVKHGKAA